MRYRELFKLGWALTWREMAWCTVVGVPSVMVIGLIFAGLGLELATNPAIFVAALAMLAVQAVVYLTLPDQRVGAIGSMVIGLLVTNPAVSAIMLKTPYRGFRLDIVREA